MNIKLPFLKALIIVAGCAGESVKISMVTDAGTDSGSSDPVSDCGQQPQVPLCESQAPASSGEGAEAFIEANAVSLTCFDGAQQRVEADYLVEHIGASRAILFGEIHGSNEVGPLSAALFDALLEAEKVDALALEAGMDTTDAWNSYVEDGSTEDLEFYDLDELERPVFWSTLAAAARARAIQGEVIPVFAVDFPWRMAWVNECIEEMAAGAGPTASLLILDGLPDAKEYLVDTVDAEYVQEVSDYRQHLADNETDLCTLMGETDCERLTFLAKALYVSAFLFSTDAGSATGAQWQGWTMEREQLMAHNMERIFSYHQREAVYGHMGAAHVLKGNYSMAFRLDTSFEPTEDLVYSLRPAYGEGSAISYNSATSPLLAFPPEATVLANDEDASYFIPATTPGFECEPNPLPNLPGDLIPTESLGTLYDAYIWFDHLTPEL